MSIKSDLAIAVAPELLRIYLGAGYAPEQVGMRTFANFLSPKDCENIAVLVCNVATAIELKLNEKP